MHATESGIGVCLTYLAALVVLYDGTVAMRGRAAGQAGQAVLEDGSQGGLVCNLYSAYVQLCYTR